MMPNLDPRTMATAMKRLGIKQTEIQAKQVIIKTGDREIIITNPSVLKINMMGQDSFQISGEVSVVESPNNDFSNEYVEEVSKEDVNTVIEHANCSEESARETLKITKGDIAEAILRLKKV